jgi:hypothetical protein
LGAIQAIHSALLTKGHGDLGRADEFSPAAFPASKKTTSSEKWLPSIARSTEFCGPKLWKYNASKHKARWLEKRSTNEARKRIMPCLIWLAIGAPAVEFGAYTAYQHRANF